MTSKPRLVTLSMAATGHEPVSLGTIKLQATHYVMKIYIGGVAGALAPILGKEPKDMHFWVINGEAPICVRWKGQFYDQGPMWRIDMAIPTLP